MPLRLSRKTAGSRSPIEAIPRDLSGCHARCEFAGACADFEHTLVWKQKVREPCLKPTPVAKGGIEPAKIAARRKGVRVFGGQLIENLGNEGAGPLGK